MSPVLAQVLYNRGLSEPDAAVRFLNAEPGDLNPFRMKGMNKAVERINRAIRERERIVVYGDFDADGVTATALLVQALRALGAVVRPYIPHRVDEGYGLNSEALHGLKRSGVDLVITVDCGIRSLAEAEDARNYGLDLIVTDHHSIGPEVPRALAVINPKQEDCRYPENMLAGVGIAYKLADALFRAANASNRRPKPHISLESLLDLVAIGTVADLAPLNRSENRLLVREGLKALNNGSQRLGVKKLLETAGVQHRLVDATAIGFAIGPRINAAGRLAGANIAYELLAGIPYEGYEAFPLSEQEIQSRAEELDALNQKRRVLTQEAQALIRERLEQTGEVESPLIMASDASFLPGIVGLVAGRLAEEYYRPAVIMEEGKDGESHGSCRSIPEFDITAALDQCADLLVRHGGHAQAAGFTVRNGDIPALRERLMGIAADALTNKDLRPTLEIDADVPPAQLTLELAEELAQLEPMGQANATPLLMSRQMVVDAKTKKTVGQDGRHLKLRLMAGGTPLIDAIGFNLGDRLADLPELVDVAYRLDVNEFNGRRTAQLVLQDIRPAEERA